MLIIVRVFWKTNSLQASGFFSSLIELIVFSINVDPKLSAVFNWTQSGLVWIWDILSQKLGSIGYFEIKELPKIHIKCFNRKLY